MNLKINVLILFVSCIVIFNCSNPITSENNSGISELNESGQLLATQQTEKILSNFTLMKQWENGDTDFWQCGPTSLAMVNKYYGKSPSDRIAIKNDLVSIGRYWLADATNKITITDQNCNNYKPMYPKYVHVGDYLAGTYPDYLFQVARNYYDSQFIITQNQNMTLNDIKNAIDKSAPVIVDVWAHTGSIGSPNKFTHFVVVTGYRLNANNEITDLYINDPLPDNGKIPYWINKDIFSAAWNSNPDYQVNWGMIISRKAELIPTAIIFNSSSLIAGNNVFFDSGIQNTSIVGTGVFNIKWFVDGAQVGYGSHSGIPANSTVLNGNSQFTWKAVSGTHTIKFIVDADNHVPEINENNNSISVTVTVKVVQFADLLPTNILYTASSLKAGNNVFFDSGIQNTGSVGTGVFNIKWFVDGAQVGYGSHSGIPANSTVLNGNSQFTWKAVSGTHNIKFIVDADNHISESNENNNSKGVTVSIP